MKQFAWQFFKLKSPAFYRPRSMDAYKNMFCATQNSAITRCFTAKTFALVR
jgi:hypothetical protein